VCPCSANEQESSESRSAPARRLINALQSGSAVPGPVFREYAMTVAADSWRVRLADLVESARVQRVIMTLIVLTAITLGLETSPAIMSHAGDVLHAIDRIVLTVFVIEIAAKLAGRGLGFFRSGWNV